uniref:Uncharacterized protein n=1 Tax=Rhodnius prolixus TaxID=13249 RepID=T1HFA2_RHOPR
MVAVTRKAFLTLFMTIPIVILISGIQTVVMPVASRFLHRVTRASRSASYLVSVSFPSEYVREGLTYIIMLR